MSTRIQEREWRNFEILVSRLEGLLQPNGITVRSPDHLLDHDTGELREVDCAMHDASTGSVTSIECRKRKKKQDVLWIEQLVTKRDALGLAKTIAVSSVGFSKAAAKKAAKHGILLKTFTEATSADVLAEFRRDLQLLHKSQIASIVGLEVGIDDEGWAPPDDLLDDFQARLEREQGATALLYDTGTKNFLSVQWLLDYGLGQMQVLPVGLHRKKFQLTLQAKTYALAHREPVAYVESVKITMDVNVTEHPVAGVRLHQYAADDDIQLELATAQMTTARFGPVKLQIAFKRLS